MSSPKYKIGDVAQRTGVTVRTLRYYDEIGLLIPSERQRSGYRLYGVKELERLQQILSLKQLGFQLQEIKTCLEDPEKYKLENILFRQMKELRVEIELHKKLYHQLQKLAEHLQSTTDISIDNLFKTIKAMKMHEKYYSEEQLKTLEKRRKEMGEEGMQKVSREWEDLINKVKAEMKKGTDPTSEKVQKLATQWESLIKKFTGGDPEMRQSLNNLYKAESHKKASLGYWDKDMSEYMCKALKVVNK